MVFVSLVSSSVRPSSLLSSLKTLLHLSGFVAVIYASQRYSSFRSLLLWFFVALIFDDVFSVELKWLSLMSLGNSGFFVDVVGKYFGYVDGVFE